MFPMITYMPMTYSPNFIFLCPAPASLLSLDVLQTRQMQPATLPLHLDSSFCVFSLHLWHCHLPKYSNLNHGSYCYSFINFTFCFPSGIQVFIIFSPKYLLDLYLDSALLGPQVPGPRIQASNNY